jgi:hypothetical protein
MNAVDHILSHYGHMKLDLVAQFVQACLEYWRTMDERDEPNDGMPLTTVASSSVIQGSQFSQRGAIVPPVTKKERSPSKQLLLMLEERLSIQPMETQVLSKK